MDGPSLALHRLRRDSGWHVLYTYPISIFEILQSCWDGKGFAWNRVFLYSMRFWRYSYIKERLFLSDARSHFISLLWRFYDSQNLDFLIWILLTSTHMRMCEFRAGEGEEGTTPGRTAIKVMGWAMVVTLEIGPQRRIPVEATGQKRPRRVYIKETMHPSEAMGRQVGAWGPAPQEGGPTFDQVNDTISTDITVTLDE